MRIYFTIEQDIHDNRSLKKHMTKYFSRSSYHSTRILYGTQNFNKLIKVVIGNKKNSSNVYRHEVKYRYANKL